MSNLTRRNFLGLAGLGTLGFGLAACSNESSTPSVRTSGQSAVGADSNLVDAAKGEGSLQVLGSCGEDYLGAACKHFNELYGLDVSYKRISSIEGQTLIENSNGSPQFDVWFGGTTDPYNELSDEGLLDASYTPANSSHLMNDVYLSQRNDWFGIYKGLLGFMYNKDEIERLNIDAPKDWPDLVDDKYKGLIWMPNYQTSGTARLILNTVIQEYGHQQGLEYLTQLDKNVQEYTKTGGGPAENIGSGECVIGIGFLHDGVAQIEDNGYENIGLVIPTSGASYEVGATAALIGAAHPNAAHLWLEYALSPECVELAAKNGSYQTLVIDTAHQPSEISKHHLNPDDTIDYDFEDARLNTKEYVGEIMDALGGGKDSRFQNS